eukprot:CAMPEP_0174275500 /NCGR_PEP_ID=MMETSP0439-20130205/59857_1 /TAXON_ID=0 /ORGANISM="Stereomyxa ramosa, Strain Chinc5" /LENGTH=697 /DNA_ID=CAMNT_0015367605 /DNA_START=88 /DNA_END=2181 /DNA_ORIENTATION=+
MEETDQREGGNEETQKRFALGDEVDPRRHYFVEREELLATFADNFADDGNDQLAGLFGHSQSGKSTFLLGLKAKLEEKGHKVILLDCSDLDFESFWSSVGDLIQEPSVDSRSSFKKLFKSVDTVCVLLDEVQTLLDNRSLGGELLNTFRNLKRKPRVYPKFVGLLGVGLYDMRHVKNLGTSSFKFTSLKAFPGKFTQSECAQLFQDYTQHTKIEVTKELVSYIYEQTGGHPGLLSFCGDSLHRIVLSYEPNIETDLQRWASHCQTLAFESDVASCDVVEKILHRLRMEQNQRLFLRDVLIPYGTFVGLGRTNDEIASLETLAIIGVLDRTVKNGDTHFSFSSPLIRTCCYGVIGMRLLKDPRPIEKEDFSQIIKQPDQILPFVCRLLPFMRSATLLSGLSDNQCRLKDSSTGVMVPSEHAYEIALLQALIKRLNKTHYRVVSQPKVSAKRADLLIADGDNILLELEVNPTRAIHKEHVGRTADDYRKLFGREDRDIFLFVIAFITSETIVKKCREYIVKDVNGVCSIFVWHNSDFSELKIFHKHQVNGDVIVVEDYVARHGVVENLQIEDFSESRVVVAQGEKLHTYFSPNRNTNVSRQFQRGYCPKPFHLPDNRGTGDPMMTEACTGSRRRTKLTDGTVTKLVTIETNSLNDMKLKVQQRFRMMSAVKKITISGMELIDDDDLEEIRDGDEGEVEF